MLRRIRANKTASICILLRQCTLSATKNQTKNIVRKMSEPLKSWPLSFRNKFKSIALSRLSVSLIGTITNKENEFFAFSNLHHYSILSILKYKFLLFFNTMAKQIQTLTITYRFALRNLFFSEIPLRNWFSCSQTIARVYSFFSYIGISAHRFITLHWITLL